MTSKPMHHSAYTLVLFASWPAFSEDWNPRLAADYLDARQKEWFAWKPANAPGGPCVSCHTGVTYLLARPALRRALGESEPTSYEMGLTTALRARVDKKVAQELFPAFAKEPRASQAIGVEAILCALFLTLDEAERPSLSAAALQAFDRMWSLQILEGKAKGAWAWFDLDLDPWETPASPFYGATLAAMAVGSAPAEYRARPEVRRRVAELTAYLKREQQAQPLHNRLMLLWASTKLSEVLPRSGQKSIMREIWQKQEADGGWTIDALGPWKTHPAATPSVGSNSYATALTALAMRKAGVARADPGMIRALNWLKERQDRQAGFWTAQSMNKQYGPGSMQSRFMQDAASAYSAMALLE